MSDERDNSPVLDKIVLEAREGMRPELQSAEPDWERMEAALMKRVEAEKQVQRLGGSRIAWGGAAAALAVAAAAAMLLGRAPVDSPSLDAPVATVTAHEVSSLAARQGAGEVRVNGVAAPTGQSIRVGDTIEVRNVKAIFDRPGKVTWTVEEAQLPSMRETIMSKTTVRSDVPGGGPLVLALDHGAIEAEVTPVASGEAFAIDVGDLRVAVHGTHLRVARSGSRVVVDLTEGVVSVGRPPRHGSTYGTLVTAPAHVELDLDSPDRPFKIDHAKESVRPANPLREFVGSSPRVASAANVTAPEQPSRPPTSPRVPPLARRDDRKPENAGSQQVAQADPHPEETIVSAVKACAQQSKPLPSGVSLTVTSTLQLKIGEDGIAESAKFDPPLSPEVQTCAAATIYKTRFEKPAAGASPFVQIPFELQKF